MMKLLNIKKKGDISIIDSSKAHLTRTVIRILKFLKVKEDVCEILKYNKTWEEIKQLVITEMSKNSLNIDLIRGLFKEMVKDDQVFEVKIKQFVDLNQIYGSVFLYKNEDI